METLNSDEDQKPCPEELQAFLEQTLSESDSSENNCQQMSTAVSDQENQADQELEPCYGTNNIGHGSAPLIDVSCKSGGEVVLPRSLSDFVAIVALKHGNGKGYLIEGFVFIRDRCRNGNMYLKCRNRFCKARAIISRLNIVSLGGTGHHQACTPAGAVKAHHSIRQVSSKPAQMRKNTLPVTSGSESNIVLDAMATDRGEVDNFQVSRFHPPSSGLPDSADVNRCSQDDTDVTCYSGDTDSIGQDSWLPSLPHSDVNAPLPVQSSRTPSRTYHHPILLRRRNISTGRCPEDLNAASSSHPYPISLNASPSLVDNDNAETSPTLELPQSRQHRTLVSQPSYRQALHQNSQQIRSIFRAFRDVRSKVSVLQQYQNFPPLKNDLILRAAKGEKTERVPVWVMRQAGRYLPEFQAVRKEHEFFEICQTPELACEVTLQPIARFDLDAAIIFSDILVIPQVLGIHVEMVSGKGLVFDNTLSSPEDLARLHSDVDVTEALSYVFDAITLTRRRLEGKVPLIGFSGAPWTLMGYCIEGTGNSMTLSKAKKWLFAHPEQSHKFLQLLTDKIVDYLVGQVLAGAQLLQVFDSNVGVLGYDLFMTFALPYLKQIVTKVKSTLQETNFEPVPMIVFAKGAHYALEELSKTGYDVISLDWTIRPEVARAKVGPTVSLQGNLDPCAMYSSKDDIEGLVGKMLNNFGTQRYIANLGHGVYPDFDPEHVRTFIDTVHAQSEAMNKRSARGTQPTQ